MAGKKYGKNLVKKPAREVNVTVPGGAVVALCMSADMASMQSDLLLLPTVFAGNVIASLAGNVAIVGGVTAVAPGNDAGIAIAVQNANIPADNFVIP